ncbi:MAG: hypothetical protein ACYCOU_19270, partial [Sulfobacillus sp.]
HGALRRDDADGPGFFFALRGPPGLTGLDIEMTDRAGAGPAAMYSSYASFHGRTAVSSLRELTQICPRRFDSGRVCQVFDDARYTFSSFGIH